MMNLIPWFTATAILLLLFIILLLIGIVKKKVNLVIGAVACFLGFMVAGSITAYKTLRRTIKFATDVTKQRDGNQLYADILGTPTACVKIYAASDPVFATINAPASLCFSTCPAEVNRVLNSRSFEIVKRPTADVALEAEQCCDNYFSYARFGDTLLECVSSEATNHVCTLWISTDSAHGFLQNY